MLSFGEQYDTSAKRQLNMNLGQGTLFGCHLNVLFKVRLMYMYIKSQQHETLSEYIIKLIKPTFQITEFVSNYNLYKY